MLAYEIIYDADYTAYVDEDGNRETETITLSQRFDGTHIELLEHIKQMQNRGYYNIQAEEI